MYSLTEKNVHRDTRRDVWRWFLKMLMPQTELSVNCSRGQVNSVCSQVKCYEKSHQVNRAGTGEKYHLQDCYPEIDCTLCRPQHFPRKAGRGVLLTLLFIYQIWCYPIVI